MERFLIFIVFALNKRFFSYLVDFNAKYDTMSLNITFICLESITHILKIAQWGTKKLEKKHTHAFLINYNKKEAPYIQFTP